MFGGSPRAAAVDRARVVLDAVAEPDFLHHLEVVLGAHPQALGLEQLPLTLELRQTLLQLGLDPRDGDPHPLLARHVVRGGEDDELLQRRDGFAGERIDDLDALDLVSEQLDAHRRLVIGRMDFDRVAPHPELAAHEVHVVPLVVHVHQPAEDGALVVLLTRSDHEQLVAVLLG